MRIWGDVRGSLPVIALSTADSWFASESLPGGVTRLWEPHVDPLLRSNLFHVAGADAYLLVDSGCGIAPLRPALERLGLLSDRRRVIVVATHSHFDHVGGLHEFDERLAHPAEAGLIAEPPGDASLLASSIPPDIREQLAESGLPVPELLIDALPDPGFDASAYSVVPAPATQLVEEGDVVDLGDRRLTVLHLPGHSPGGIGLLELETGVLFSGDAIYDGPLVDNFPDADVDAYCETMRRLKALPVSFVHGGHDPSFGPARLVEIADGYLEQRLAA
jgi:glyoxylase-like metal-dependent hydrolase (beta-lactamase superfamily II)